jgi:hypothetical protein
MMQDAPYATAYIEVSNLRHNTGSSFMAKKEIGEGPTKQKKKAEFAVSVLAALPLLYVCSDLRYLPFCLSITYYHTGTLHKTPIRPPINDGLTDKDTDHVRFVKAFRFSYSR